MNQGLEKAIAKAGSRQGLARLLGISKQAVCKWTSVPSRQIIRIEAATGVPRELLRPDLYRRD
jgi:DNA-binding transcriptional regulator YdaS (Cro superfamily)